MPKQLRYIEYRSLLCNYFLCRNMTYIDIAKQDTREVFIR